MMWKNWAGNERAFPIKVHEPECETDIVAVVGYANALRQRVKVVGSGHSFTAIAVAPDHLVKMTRYNKALSIDVDKLEVTVESGIVISDLNKFLANAGYAMPNLGDVTYQTISGALSTSTHGTGALRTGLAAQIAAFRIVVANGDVLSCSPTENSEIFHCGRVGLGALGILSTITLRIVPAFRLQAVEEPMRIDALLADLDRHVAENDFFEFFWIPHTGWALTKRNNVTQLPADPPSNFKTWFNKMFMENIAFGALCYVGRLFPHLIPRLSKALPSTGRTEYVNASHQIFASKRIVRFYEMEYSIRRDAVVEALNRVRKMVDEKGLLLNFPVEVRFTAGDDIPLSTGSGRDNAYIAVHVFKGMKYELYFREVEAIMSDYDGRPHWGKIHFKSAVELERLYPEWKRYIEVRNRLDPEGVFTNDYLRRVLGR
ncbi:MAG: FAD-binding protein [Actinobacteria bacterium]|nr:MAG: FAD-binding protein [Actinomycetota bacterium]